MPHVYVEKADYDELATVSEVIKHVIPRTTEITGVLDCEVKATLHPVHTGKREWKELSTYVALKGTILHHKIENFCREKIDLPPIPLELSAGDKIMYQEILNDPKALEWMINENQKGWENFEKFWFDFKPTVLVPEQTMIYIHRDKKGNIIHKKSLKGTVDFLCEIDPDRMTEKAFKILPISDKMTVMIDWKSGSSKQVGHHAQLEGYHWMLGVTGIWDELIEQGVVHHPFAHITNATGRSYPVAICLLLGGKYYKAHVYDLTEGMFKEARDVFLEPRPIVLSRSKWANNVFREGYHCNFCVYRDTDCPIFRIYHRVVDLEVVTP